MTVVGGRPIADASSPTEDASNPPRLLTPARLAGAAGLGLLAGAAWGAAARVWMRWISESPEFTWEGTLAIIAVTALAGTCLAVMDVLRCAGTGPARLLLAVPALLMFAGAGLVLLPGALLLGLAFSGRLRPWLAVSVAWLAQAPGAMLVHELAFTLTPYPKYLQVGGMMVLVLALGAGWRTVFARRGAR